MKPINPFSPSPYREPGRDPDPPASTPLALLGAVEHEYRAKRCRGTALYYGAAIAVMFVFATVTLLALSSPTAHIASLVFLVILVGGAAFVLTPSALHLVLVHDNGIVAIRGRKSERLLWDDVRHLFRSGRAGAPLALSDGVGRKIIFGDGIPDVDALADRLERKLSVPLIGPARAALADGDRLAFGPVTLDRDGIAWGLDHAAWTDVRVARVGRTCAIWKRDALAPFANVDIAELPHPRVFFALVEDRIGVKALEYRN